jgi:PhnB protein
VGPDVVEAVTGGESSGAAATLAAASVSVPIRPAPARAGGGSIEFVTRPLAFASLTPYLRCPDGDAAAGWLCRVLGFGPARSVRTADGTWSEGEIAIGPVRADISSGAPPSGRGEGTLLIIRVSDVDARYERIRAAGAQIDPPTDEAYGPRSCHVTDPWGCEWYIWPGDASYPPE